MLSRFLSLEKWWTNQPRDKHCHPQSHDGHRDTHTVQGGQKLSHCHDIFMSLCPSDFICHVIHCTVTAVSDKLARGTVVQEFKYVPILWNNSLSFRGGFHIAWCLWDSRPLRLSTVCHFLPGIHGLVISLPIVLAGQRPTWLQLAIVHNCLYDLMVVQQSALSKRLFPCLYFFLSYLTPGKLNCEIRVQWNCHPGFDI